MNHNRNTLSLNTLHNTLDGALTEFVAVALHGQTVYEKNTGYRTVLCFLLKFRAEDDIFAVELFSYTCRVANRNGGFDDHNRFWVISYNQLNHRFNRRCVEMLCTAIVVCWCAITTKSATKYAAFASSVTVKFQFFFCEIFSI